ncbi:AAA family ATPase [Bacillus spizizenii]|nr:AAA family ATPase [Bacillus spizizenii]
MAEFFYRTEEIKLEEISKYFVESKQDRQIIEQLKSRTPVILVGSRGVGKSFLFRVAQYELMQKFASEKVMPVYVTFRGSSLIHTNDPQQFHHWMISRICHELIRVLEKSGKLTKIPTSLNILTAGNVQTGQVQKTNIELIAEAFEESWKDPGKLVNTEGLPSTDRFLDAVEDLCQELDINRVVVFIDEAAHVFMPEQQRQFFTLFRDIRNPYISCNAAVYPGVTVYGETFQPIHDASVINLNRDVLDDDYLNNMREIVSKQAEDSSIMKNILRRGENFAILSYASSGNPRHLLKTLLLTNSLESNSVNKVIREYYRTDIWSEHSKLAEKYVGHRVLIDWGRKFIEGEVLQEIQQKNLSSLDDDKKTSCYFWIHRDAPQAIKEALRLLEYTGVVREHAFGIKATRSHIGIRYFVNIGALLALESTPTSKALTIVKALSIKKMTEYGENSKVYDSLISEMPSFDEPNMSEILKEELKKPIEVLDLTEFQKEKILSLELYTVGDILRAPESKLREAYQVGEKRARRIRNVAMIAVYEYLSD